MSKSHIDHKYGSNDYLYMDNMTNVNPDFMEVPTDYVAGGSQMDFDMPAVPGTSGLQNNGSLLRRRRPSSGSGHDNAEDLIRMLPSVQLANSVQAVTRSDSWKKKVQNRRPGLRTVRFRHSQALDVEEIAERLMQDPDFIDASPDEQTDNIKNIPSMTLTNKKAVRKQLRQNQKKQNKKPSWFKRVRYNISMSWKRTKVGGKELMYSMELWRSHLKKIEGNFGTGVASYFLFLKWLFLLNLPTFFLTFSFLTIPQIVYRWEQQDPPGYNENATFTGEELLTGGGFFYDTELYYGYYHHGIINTTLSHGYNMPYAYFFTSVGYYVLALIIVAVSLARSYSRNYVDDSDEFGLVSVTKVLCGWDYNITVASSSSLKQKSIFKELQEYLADGRKHAKQETCAQVCCLVVFRILTNLAVLGLLAGCGYILWYISVTQSLANDLAFFKEMALSLCVSAVNFILPIAFSILAQFERYRKPRTELMVTMVRTIILNFVSLGVLIYFWFYSVNCTKDDPTDQMWLDSGIECQPCWETFMGEQIYRLVIVDFIFILCVTFISEFLRRIMGQYCCKSMGFPEFNIGRNTLNLIYSQMLVWLATFYSPLMTLINILKLFIIFYVKRVSVLQNCRPSVKPWRAGRTHTVILGLLSMAFLLCFFAVGYSVFFLVPSRLCGPFQNYNLTYHVVNEIIDLDNAIKRNEVVALIIQLVTSMAFAVGLLIFLCVIAYYCGVVANGHKDMVRLLRNQVSMEGRDKAFLLRLLQDASKKHGTSHPRMQSSMPSLGPAGNTPASGGKRFAKQEATFANSRANQSATSLSNVSGSGVARVEVYTDPHVVANETYLETSLEHDEADDGVSFNPAYTKDPNRNLQPMASNNPSYRETSPNTSPNYMASHYSQMPG